MYRKDADRYIVREVPNRPLELRQLVPWANWRMAVLACQMDHPDWFDPSEPDVFERLEPILRAEGVDMSAPDPPFDLVGNQVSD